MFTETKSRLRIKLRDWLGICDIENDLSKNKVDIHKALFNHEKNIENLESKFSKLQFYTTDTMIVQNNKIQGQDNKIDILHRTVENVVHIGTDVERYPNRNSGSWAVICVEGKVNMVKFVELNGRDCRDISYFLKQYEAGRHCIDAPHYELFLDAFTINKE